MYYILRSPSSASEKCRKRIGGPARGERTAVQEKRGNGDGLSGSRDGQEKPAPPPYMNRENIKTVLRFRRYHTDGSETFSGSSGMEKRLFFMRILLAEDEPAMAEAIVAFLRYHQFTVD